MAVYHYDWGTERPIAWKQRLVRIRDEEVDQALVDLDREMEERRARILKKKEDCQRQIEFVDAVTPGGRYCKELAQRLRGVQATAEPVKRGRGRPRKYGPDNPPPPRKSRAKVRLVSSKRSSPASKGASEARSSSAGRRASLRTTSGTVSPVTAAPARVPTPAPKAAPQVAAALLQSTLAGGLGVDTIQIETSETAFEIKPVETRTVQITVVENDPEYEAELAEQKAQAQALLDAENEPGEELPPVGAPRKKTKFSLNYDFSDALDRSKVDPAVLALFPHIGLPRTQPSEAMSDEELKQWLFATRYKKEADDEAREERFQDSLRIYRNAAGIYKAVRRLIEKDIQRERDRVEVWHVIDQRVVDAEHYSSRAAHGEIDPEQALMWMAHRDYLALGNLEDSEHLVWREIVDAMEWPKGFSRIDLAIWAGQDPNVVPDVRSWAGPPKIFPEHLRNYPFPP
jgi:hypothetical protein